MALSRGSVIAFLLSVMIGASCGVLMILLRDEPFRVEFLPGFLMILFWASLFSLPYVGAGLALFGLPVTWLLQRYFVQLWFGLVAAAWGGAAGAITYSLYDYIRWGGTNELAEITGLQNAGPVYGVPTGLAWWLLYRRVLVKYKGS